MIVLLGSALGVAGGLVFGQAMIASYHGFFRLPVLAFELTPWSAVAGAAISLAAASLGVLTALRNVISLAPAVAMRPAAPLRFRRSWIEALLSARALSPRRIMMLRNFAGRPLRSSLTIVGIAFAVPMVVLGLFWRDAIDHMIEVQFNLVERGNTMVTFPQPRDRAIISDLAREPGVLAVEGQRIVPVRLRAGHRTYLTSVIGLPAGSELRRPARRRLASNRGAARRDHTHPKACRAAGCGSRRSHYGRGDGGPTAETRSTDQRQRRRDDRDGFVYGRSIRSTSLTGEGAVVSAATMYVEPSALLDLSRRFKSLPVDRIRYDEVLYADVVSRQDRRSCLRHSAASSRRLR